MVAPIELPGLDTKSPKECNTKKNKQPIIANFEEAILLAGYGRFQVLATFSSALCLVTVATEGISIGFILPAAQCDFDMSIQQKGLLGATPFIGFILSAHMWGAVGDVFGRRRIMMYAISASALSGAMSSLAPTYIVMLVLRFITGFMSCAPAGLSYAYISEFHDISRKSRGILSFSSLCALLACSVPILAFFIIPSDWVLHLPAGLPQLATWRLFILSCAIPNLLAALVLKFCMPESPKFLLERGNHAQALAVLQYIFKFNTGRPASEFPVHALQSEKEALGDISEEERKSTNPCIAVWRQTAPLFERRLLGTTIILTFLIMCSNIGFYPLFVWGPEILNRLSRSTSNSSSFCDVVRSSVMTNVSFNFLQENENFDIAIDLQIFHYNVSDRSDNIVIDCDATVENMAFHTLMILNVATALACMISGLAVNLLGCRLMLVVIFLSSAGLTAILPFLHQIEFQLPVYVITIAIACALPGLTLAAAIDLIPTNLRGMAGSLAMMMGRVGMMCGTLIFGWFLETSCESSFFFVSCSMIFGAGLSLVLKNSK